METQSEPTVSHGRVLAFRIVAGVFGTLTLLLTIGGAISVLTTEKDKIHSFHVLGSLPVYVLLTSLPLIVLAMRPMDVVALRVAWGTAIGTTIAAIIGQDLFTGLFVIAPVVLLILTFLSPTRSELLRFGSPTIALLSLAVLGAIPAVIYAWDNARIQLQMDPSMDMTGHWSGHHWSGIAGAALALVVVGLILAFRSPGDRMWIWSGGLAAMLFGLAGIIFSDDVRYPSSIGTLWAVLVLFAGLVYIAVAEVSSRADAEAVTT
jgi:hypothetical protein